MKHYVAAVSLMALAGCATEGEVYRSYFETGSIIDGGSFGNANAQNHLVMRGEGAYVFNLANRFSNEVMTTVNFAFDSAQLDAGARDTLREQAKWIKQFPEIKFKVYGHTDLVGSNAYNKSLGLRRAQTVVNYLVSQGISRSRLKAVVSFGETQPLIVTQGRERRNRRTVTEVSGFVRSHPTVVDGKYAEVIHREYINSAQPRSTLILVEEGTEIAGSDE